MNEAQIRERLRQAVGEGRYPAGFSSRVEARLRQPALDQDVPTNPGRNQSPWLVGLRLTLSLVAALLVVLVLAALLVGVYAWRIHSEPAGRYTAIKQYQEMLRADQQTLDGAMYDCSVGDAGCPSVVAGQSAVLRQWLADLNGSQPPARFLALDALMRRHLALALSANNDFVIAYEENDPDRANTAYNAHNWEINTLEHEAGAIITSSQGSMVSYSSAVRLDREFLRGCGLCQSLVNPDGVSCQSSQRQTCVDELFAVRLQVETFQSDLVFGYAPDALAAKDQLLQAHLVAADAALNAMESALSAGNQVGFQTGLDALRQALTQIDFDATSIAGR
jgi:hypothetical protein